MKNKKIKVVLALCCALMCCCISFGGCGASEANNDINIENINLSEYSGVYTGNEYLFDFHFSESFYICRDPEGRIGKGPCGYENNELHIIFDDFYYNIDIDESGNMHLRQNGSGINVESLNDFVLTATPDETYYEYDMNDFNGERSNSDVILHFDIAAGECTYTYTDGVGGCTISDDFNGKGPYLYMGEYKAYFIAKPDGTLSFEINSLEDSEEANESFLKGSFKP